MKKKPILWLLLLFVLFGSTVTSVSATNRTQDEAINWVKSKVGQYLDMDGAYGAQCVDLILAYYDYLGVARSSGNGADYAWNTLPAGWSRVQGGHPQKGDILVYGASGNNPYGHVAIYESDYSTYHQNFDGSPVRQVTYRYDGLSNPYWGYIRPNWNSGSINPTWENTTNSITETNAMISTTVTMPYQGNFSFAGVCFYNESGQLIKQMSENVSYNSSYMKVWYDVQGEMGITLQPGTTYKYQFLATFNGAQYKSPMWSFKTGGTVPVTPIWAYSAANITATDARIVGYVSMSYEGQFSSIGVCLYSVSGQLLKEKTNSVLNTAKDKTNVCNIQTDMDYVLSPGTTYKYQFYCTFNGTRYNGPVREFTTLEASKNAQPMTVAVKQGSVSFSKLKKANQTIKKISVFNVKKAQGKVTFAKVSGSGKLLISKSGVITVKKGASKGTYSMKVKVTAAGNDQYKGGSKTVTVKIKVK